jgi:hypothetical protein
LTKKQKKLPVILGISEVQGYFIPNGTPISEFSQSEAAMSTKKSSEPKVLTVEMIQKAGREAAKSKKSASAFIKAIDGRVRSSVRTAKATR